MKTTLKILLPGLVVSLFLGTLTAQQRNAQPEQQPRYLAFQIFTYGPNPMSARMGEGKDPHAGFPDKATLRDYIEDIKRRIGTVGDGRTRLGVVLGPLSFDHTDAEVTSFIQLGFQLALETDVAVGFHIDDSMFWTRRKDLWSDPNNVEALDWQGTPCTGRRLDWQTAPGAKPDFAPPQMCFNSKVILREVQQRSTLLGKAIQAGVTLLQQRNRPELFAGVIAGWETMIGQDFETGKYLGFRALLNRGFTREHPPADMDLEREKVVQEFVELWARGFADAGVPQQKIYSHIAPFAHRAFNAGSNKETSYSQHNHFATTSVAFGKYHQPGFSTYPAPGRFDDIYEELDKHRQVAWASSEGTNLQLGAGPGQSGMTMETYLAKMFNHGATLVNVYSWGIGGDSNKNMSFRMVTEGDEALGAYRKFLKGDALIEGQISMTLLERLPPKIRKIQEELPAWIQKADNKDHAAEATALMQKLQEQLKSRSFEEAEKTTDSILKLMGAGAQSAAPAANVQVGSPLDSGEDVRRRLTEKVERIKKVAQEWAASGRDPSSIGRRMEEKVKPLLDAGKFVEAEVEVDRVLQQLQQDGRSAEPPAAVGPVQQQIPEETRKEIRHKLDSSFVVFRDKVQEELKLSREQKEKLEAVLPDAVKFFKKIKDLTPEEQEKELRAYRPVAHQRLVAVLQETLNEGQRTRLRQIELQRDQLFGGEIWKELHITDEQQKQFMPLIQQTQKKTRTLMAELQKGGNLVEIRSQVLNSRADLERQLEALLTDAQKDQWKDMLGKPMDVNDIFDM